MSGVLLVCSTREGKLGGPPALGTRPTRRVEFQALETKALEIFDPEKADVLFHRMALFETCAVPVQAGVYSQPGKYSGDGVFSQGVASPIGITHVG
jgi:hypothetical protein